VSLCSGRHVVCLEVDGRLDASEILTFSSRKEDFGHKPKESTVKSALFVALAFKRFLFRINC
jgi:hypothetical protein